MRHVLFVAFSLNIGVLQRVQAVHLVTEHKAVLYVNWLIRVCICFGQYVTFTYIYFLTCLLNHNVFSKPHPYRSRTSSV